MGKLYLSPILLDLLKKQPVVINFFINLLLALIKFYFDHFILPCTWSLAMRRPSFSACVIFLKPITTVFMYSIVQWRLQPLEFGVVLLLENSILSVCYK